MEIFFVESVLIKKKNLQWLVTRGNPIITDGLIRYEENSQIPQNLNRGTINMLDNN